MPGNRRRTLRLTIEADDRLMQIASRRQIQANDAMRVALGLLDVFEQAREKGEFVGATRDRGALTTVFVSPL